MAALSIAVALAGPSGPAVGRAGDPAPIKRKVTLNIRFSGPVGQKAEVVVKPGNAASRFKPIARAIDPNTDVPFGPFEVETYNAGGDASFAITVKEPGQPDKTIRRLLPLGPKAGAIPAGKADGPIVLNCYVSSRSLSAPPAVAEKAEGSKRKE